jgi:hypothetical protein
MKLDGDLQPTLLITSINFSKLYDYKWHLLRLLNMCIKEIYISILICDPMTFNIWQTRKPMVENMDLCFFHH